MCVFHDVSSRVTLDIATGVIEDFEPHINCTNVEFSDIVNGKFVRDYNLNLDYFNKWKELNSFLYESNPILLEEFNKGIKMPYTQRIKSLEESHRLAENQLFQLEKSDSKDFDKIKSTYQSWSLKVPSVLFWFTIDNISLNVISVDIMQYNI